MKNHKRWRAIFKAKGWKKIEIKKPNYYNSATYLIAWKKDGKLCYYKGKNTSPKYSYKMYNAHMGALIALSKK